MRGDNKLVSLMVEAARGHCSYDNNWEDVRRYRLLRVWLTFKCLCCIALGLIYGGEHYEADYVEVASFDFMDTYSFDDGAGKAYQALCVLRKEWKYFVMEIGWP